MGRARKYYTESDKKEARKIANAKYYLENKEACKDRYAKYRANNREAYNERRARYNASLRTHFVTYTHTNTKGDVYIGSGTNLRPYQFNSNSRSTAWHEAFSSDCQITILAEFKDKEQARDLEAILIDEHNLDTLVNKRNGKAL